MTKPLTTVDRIVRIIASNYVVDQTAVGTYPERGHIDYRAAATQIAIFLGLDDV